MISTCTGEPTHANGLIRCALTPLARSFDNGSSVKRKLDNWQLLNKFFLKHQIPLGDKELIESMVHSKDKAVAA